MEPITADVWLVTTKEIITKMNINSSPINNSKNSNCKREIPHEQLLVLKTPSTKWLKAEQKLLIWQKRPCQTALCHLYSWSKHPICKYSVISFGISVNEEQQAEGENENNFIDSFCCRAKYRGMVFYQTIAWLQCWCSKTGANPEVSALDWCGVHPRYNWYVCVCVCTEHAHLHKA